MHVTSVSQKYLIKIAVFFCVLLVLLSLGFLVQAEEAKESDKVVSAETTTVPGTQADGKEGGAGSIEVIESSTYEQTGMGSWYGNRFHGRKTASGERYDMHAYTAAHRNLPFGTILRVTNLLTDKSVLVRVNDRGPFVRGRIVDLSYAAAREIGTDLQKVKVETFLPDNADALQMESTLWGFSPELNPVKIHHPFSIVQTTEDFDEAMEWWKVLQSTEERAYLTVQPNLNNVNEQEKSLSSGKTVSYTYQLAVAHHGKDSLIASR